MHDQSTTAPVTYKIVPEFPNYRAGDDGTIWSRHDGKGGIASGWRKLRFNTPSLRYIWVILCNKGRQRRVAAHRLIAELFLPAPSAGQVHVRHLDGNPRNNRAVNLAWGTPTQNEADKIAHGTSNHVGGRNPRAKLTEANVVEIRRLLANGADLGQLARRYEVTRNLIRQIEKRRIWAHVSDPIGGS